jgi:hypothetical protein
VRGDVSDPAGAGQRLAAELKSGGAMAILNSLR